MKFDGRVAVVTGAGTGLGRAHALALARRGAKVVVNDLGTTPEGHGASSAAALQVTNEIKAGGGEAIACPANIASEAGARSVIEAAINRFGRIDILVNNAGFLRDRTFAKSSMADFEAVCAVHLFGSAYCAHAAWAAMTAQGYGRILMTTSASGLFGNFGQASYSAAKAGVIGLMHALKIEGARSGIRVNALAPAAVTRLSEQVIPEDVRAALSPDLLSEAALFLVGEDAPTGTILSGGGGHFATVRMTEARGVHLKGAPSPEALAAAWAEIDDHHAPLSFKDAMEEVNHIYASIGEARLAQ